MNAFPSVLESIKDLSHKQIAGLLSLASEFKTYSRDWEGLPHPFIKRPVIATSFLENSTRTKHSFAVAIHKLGATYIDFNAETSSLKKGETLEETFITLNCQGVDLCIIRTSISGQMSQFKENPPIKIINGGDGTHQHPTQALLDLFTMTEIGLELEGKTVSIVGDNVHSRVSHSLIDLLPQFGIKVLLCGPKLYIPSDSELPPGVESTTDVDEAIMSSDLVYLLRIQKERHGEGDNAAYASYPEKYGVDLARLKRLDKKVPVFHPGPANVGVEIGEDLMRSKYYFGHEQVKNSVFMRMAIIQAVLQNRDRKLGQRFEDKTVADLY
jgi:aspartate carbamoyltransferase catalytic subunit